MSSEKRVTISDIANEVGVSTTTISRFLSGHYQYMSKSTQERIRTVVQTSGYRPSLVARGLKSSKSYLIGVIMPEVHRPAASHSIRGICLACTDSPYSPIIISIENDADAEAQKIQELIDHRVDGILTFTGSGDEYYAGAIKNGIPVVRVDRCEDCSPIDSVYINHYDIVQDALLDLTVSGYTKIAMLVSNATTSHYSTVNIRRRSYFDFVNTSTHLSPIEYDVNGTSVSSIHEALTDFITTYPNEKKAIFVPSLEHFATVDWVCKLMGLHYPDDIALLGYTLEEVDDTLSGDLFVISQPIIDMCKVALTLISARITGGILPPEPVAKAIPASFFFRKTTLQ